ncbi:hypothetical protein ABK040_001387 [Willaertia magna]
MKTHPLLKETLKLNLKHFSEQDCWDHTCYDEFLTFLNKNIFINKNLIQNLFIEECNGLEIIYNILSENNKLSTIYMKKCSILIIGLLFKFNDYFSVNTLQYSLQKNNTLNSLQKNKENLEFYINYFKNYLINQLNLNSENNQDLIFLQTIIINSLSLFLDLNEDALQWFLNEINFIENIFKNLILIENIYLRQSIIECLFYLISKYSNYLNNNNLNNNFENDKLYNEILNKIILQINNFILLPIKENDYLEYLDFILQMITICYNDHYNTFDCHLLKIKKINTINILNLFLKFKIFEINYLNDLRILNKYFDILIYLSNQPDDCNLFLNNIFNLNLNNNSINGNQEVLNNLKKLIKISLQSGDFTLQNMATKILSNFSNKILTFLEMKENLNNCLLLWKDQFPSLQNNSLQSTLLSTLQNNFENNFENNNYNRLTMKQKGVFILGIIKSLNNYNLNLNNLNNFKDLFILLFLKTIKEFEHVNITICIKLFELFYQINHYNNLYNNKDYNNEIFKITKEQENEILLILSTIMNATCFTNGMKGFLHFYSFINYNNDYNNNYNSNDYNNNNQSMNLSLQKNKLENNVQQQELYLEKNPFSDLNTLLNQSKNSLNNLQNNNLQNEIKNDNNYNNNLQNVMNIILNRFYDIHWEIRESCVELINYLLISVINNNQNNYIFNNLLQNLLQNNKIINLLKDKLFDKEMYVVLTTIKTILNLFIYEKEMKSNFFDKNLILENLFSIVNYNCEYNIKKEIINLLNYLMNNNLINIINLNSTMLNNFVNILWNSDDVDVIYLLLQFLQSCLSSILCNNYTENNNDDNNDYNHLTNFLINTLNLKQIIEESLQFQNEKIYQSSKQLVQQLLLNYNNKSSLKELFEDILKIDSNANTNDINNENNGGGEDSDNNANIMEDSDNSVEFSPIDLRRKKKKDNGREIQNFFHFENANFDCQHC